MSDVVERVLDSVKKGLDFRLSLPAEEGFKLRRAVDDFERTAREVYEAAVDERGFRLGSFRPNFGVPVDRTYFLKRKELFEAVVENDLSKAELILKSEPDYDEDPYFFYCEYDGDWFKVVGRRARIHLLSLNRAFFNGDSEFVSLFLKERKEAASDFLATVLDPVLFGLAIEAESESVERALESFQFRTLFTFLRKSDLKSILERDYLRPISFYQESLRYFAKEVLGEELPSEWEKDFHDYERVYRPREKDLALREHLKTLALVFKRDLSVSSLTAKLFFGDRLRSLKQKRVF